MVVGYHHFRKPPCMAWNMLEHFFVSGLHCKPYLYTMLAVNCLRSASTWKVPMPKLAKLAAQKTYNFQSDSHFNVFHQHFFKRNSCLRNGRTLSNTRLLVSFAACAISTEGRDWINENHIKVEPPAPEWPGEPQRDVWSEKWFLGHHITVPVMYLYICGKYAKMTVTVTSMLFIRIYILCRTITFKKPACLSQSTVSSVTQLHVSPTTPRAGCRNSAGSNQFFQTLGEKSSWKNWLRKEMKKKLFHWKGSKSEFETLFELLWPGFLTWSSHKKKNRSFNTQKKKKILALNLRAKQMGMDQPGMTIIGFSNLAKLSIEALN